MAHFLPATQITCGSIMSFQSTPWPFGLPKWPREELHCNWSARNKREIYIWYCNFQSMNCKNRQEHAYHRKIILRKTPFRYFKLTSLFLVKMFTPSHAYCIFSSTTRSLFSTRYLCYRNKYINFFKLRQFIMYQIQPCTLSGVQTFCFFLSYIQLCVPRRIDTHESDPIYYILFFSSFPILRNYSVSNSFELRRSISSISSPS